MGKQLMSEIQLLEALQSAQNLVLFIESQLEKVGA